MSGFEAKVVLVGGGGEGNVDVGVRVEGFEEVADAGEWLGRGKVFLLQKGGLLEEVFAGNW
jgi:hypothetical protein